MGMKQQVIWQLMHLCIIAIATVVPGSSGLKEPLSPESSSPISSIEAEVPNTIFAQGPTIQAFIGSPSIKSPPVHQTIQGPLPFLSPRESTTPPPQHEFTGPTPMEKPHDSAPPLSAEPTNYPPFPTARAPVAKVSDSSAPPLPVAAPPHDSTPPPYADTSNNSSMAPSTESTHASVASSAAKPPEIVTQVPTGEPPKTSPIASLAPPPEVSQPPSTIQSPPIAEVPTPVIVVAPSHPSPQLPFSEPPRSIPLPLAVRPPEYKPPLSAIEPPQGLTLTPPPSETLPLLPFPHPAMPPHISDMQSPPAPLRTYDSHAPPPEVSHPTSTMQSPPVPTAKAPVVLPQSPPAKPPHSSALPLAAKPPVSKSPLPVAEPPQGLTLTPPTKGQPDLPLSPPAMPPHPAALQSPPVPIHASAAPAPLKTSASHAPPPEVSPPTSTMQSPPVPTAKAPVVLPQSPVAKPPHSSALPLAAKPPESPLPVAEPPQGLTLTPPTKAPPDLPLSPPAMPTHPAALQSPPVPIHASFSPPYTYSPPPQSVTPLAPPPTSTVPSNPSLLPPLMAPPSLEPPTSLPSPSPPLPPDTSTPPPQLKPPIEFSPPPQVNSPKVSPSPPQLNPPNVSSPPPQLYPPSVSSPPPQLNPPVVSSPPHQSNPPDVSAPPPQIKPPVVSSPPELNPPIISAPPPELNPPTISSPPPKLNPPILSAPPPQLNPPTISSPPPDLNPPSVSSPPPELNPPSVVSPPPELNPPSMSSPPPELNPPSVSSPPPEPNLPHILSPPPKQNPLIISYPPPQSVPPNVSSPPQLMSPPASPPTSDVPPNSAASPPTIVPPPKLSSPPLVVSPHASAIPSPPLPPHSSPPLAQLVPPYALSPDSPPYVLPTPPPSELPHISPPRSHIQPGSVPPHLSPPSPFLAPPLASISPKTPSHPLSAPPPIEPSHSSVPPPVSQRTVPAAPPRLSQTKRPQEGAPPLSPTSSEPSPPSKTLPESAPPAHQVSPRSHPPSSHQLEAPKHAPLLRSNASEPDTSISSAPPPMKSPVSGRNPSMAPPGRAPDQSPRDNHSRYHAPLEPRSKTHNASAPAPFSFRVYPTHTGSHHSLRHSRDNGSSQAMTPISSPKIPEISSAASPLPGTSPGHSGTPVLSPKISPSGSSTRNTKKPLAPPVMSLPPPPPNADCAYLTCPEPFTNTPPGSPCSCVWPMQVGLRLSVALYTFFPLVSELAREIAAGLFMKESQVRVMGANAASEQSEKSIVLVDLVPLNEKFDNVTSYLTFRRFWQKQVVIDKSIFGDYDVLYVRYPGLPPSPPMAPGDVAVINGMPYSVQDPNQSKVHPLGVDVTKQRHKHRLNGVAIAAIVFSAIVGVLICCSVAWILVFRHKKLDSQPSETLHALPSIARLSGNSTGSGPSSSMSMGSSLATYAGSAKTFSTTEIEKATDNLSPSRIIGEGGFGLVYSGVLEDETNVAVKVLKRDDLQGGREFLAEVEMLSRLHHRNLVKLIGICTDEHLRCLVYELIPNGSVDSHLHGTDKEIAPLDWASRVKIALGAARGLAYLHEDSSPRVIHRDFKSSNILLEDDFTPKVSDFGLARSAMDEENKHISTRVMGTFGYVAPEYAMTGHLLVKSDVYSYGVVLLELLTGRKPVDMTQPPGQENIVAWTRPFLTTKEGLELILDPSLGSDVPLDSVTKVAAIASMCVQPEVSHRPFMGEVVQALKLVCNECDDSKDGNSRPGSHENLTVMDFEAKASPVSETQEYLPTHNFPPRHDVEKGLSVSEIFSSAQIDEQTSDSFRTWRHSASGPLKTVRGHRFWQRIGRESNGSASEHGIMYRS